MGAGKDSGEEANRALRPAKRRVNPKGMVKGIVNWLVSKDDGELTREI